MKNLNFELSIKYKDKDITKSVLVVYLIINIPTILAGIHYFIYDIKTLLGV